MTKDTNPFNLMIDVAGEAFDALVQQYRELLEDARDGPRLTRRQKIQEYQQFMALAPEVQNRVIGELQAGGVDPEKWLADRQKLVEAEHAKTTR